MERISEDMTDGNCVRDANKKTGKQLGSLSKVSFSNCKVANLPGSNSETVQLRLGDESYRPKNI